MENVRWILTRIGSSDIEKQIIKWTARFSFLKLRFKRNCHRCLKLSVISALFFNDSLIKIIISMYMTVHGTIQKMANCWIGRIIKPM